MKEVVDSAGNMTSVGNLMAHVETIAKWVRLSGHPDEAKAFDYIESCLKEWGVSYERITHPAYISLPVRGQLTVTDGASSGGDETACITHSMGASTGPAGVAGRLVSVGAGLPVDYQKAGFTPGCVAMVDGLASPERALEARRQQAVGVVFVNGPELHEMIVSPVWGSPSAETISRLPNLPVVSILGVDGDKLKERLEIGPVTATLVTDVLTEWRPIPLLVAEIEGQVYPNDVVLLGGHVDSWHYGAMDNGSANAVQLETLRVFSQRRAELQRTLRVAFWSGHSHGRYAGSTWYVDHHFRELEERMVLHVYVDSVGGQGATVLSEAWAMSETKHVAEQVIRKVTGGEFNGGRFARGGDQSFYGVGVSALFMCLSEQPPAAPGSGQENVSALLGGNGKTGGLGPWWHAVDDLPDKLDPEFLLRDARIYLDTLAHFLEQGRIDLDFRPTVREIRGHLEDYQIAAAGKVSFADALAACDALQSEVDALYNAGLADERFNGAVVRLSRQLVPLNYSTGNRFDHDPALTLPPIPSLAPITALGQAVAGSDEEKHWYVLARRRLNFVAQTLANAVDDLHRELNR
ncbi:M28 family peptidase [Alicyclobacillus sp. ALC3]|uniref:M28 family peptidase n=1 Tax=Alicyclobacillus sp. ALC3 TaxID=2796143 RepID=UPI002377D914|nr:M28 family peptidase [Alicyclobacillus sp. ALC3]WDL98423.1 M28 family peptidase [Alicyclobacillus sp. ALC3]